MWNFVICWPHWADWYLCVCVFVFVYEYVSLKNSAICGQRCFLCLESV
jgi:hypothetical protein